MEQTFFYIVGGALVLVALLISIVGMRNDRFPTSVASTRMIGGVVALIVIVTATAAVIAARDEQQHRRDELNREAALEAEGEEAATEEAEADQGAGEAAPPESGGDVTADGGAVFVETGCGGCHSLADLGDQAVGQIGPNLDEALVDRDPEFIRTSIVDPNAEIAEGFPGGTMPQTYEQDLAPEEIDALVAYLDKVAGAPLAGGGGEGGGGNAKSGGKSGGGKGGGGN